MKTKRTEVDPPCATACAACPWRTANHRKPHPEAYYSDANRRRLWSGIRTGEAPGMTCHPTDPENQPVTEATRTRECTGAWLLIGRELEAFKKKGSAEYRRGRKLAMTRGGILTALSAMMPRPLGRGLAGTSLDADDGISIGLGTDR